MSKQSTATNYLRKIAEVCDASRIHNREAAIKAIKALCQEADGLSRQDAAPTNQTPCPTCGSACTISWSGLELVESSGDETLATKNYHPVFNQSKLGPIKDALKVNLKHLSDWKDHWVTEADSFDHPAQEAEKQLSLLKVSEIESHIKKVKSLLND